MEDVNLLRTRKRLFGPIPVTGAVTVLVIIVLALLYRFDPEHGHFLPCPFHGLTGLLCPGCGAQRAVHDLLHGRLAEAMAHNALLVLALPLLGVHWGISRWLGATHPFTADNRLILGWSVVVLGWWVARNLPGMAGIGE